MSDELDSLVRTPMGRVMMDHERRIGLLEAGLRDLRYYAGAGLALLTNILAAIILK